MASKGKADPLRNLKIRTGVVKRLAKEKQMYEQEVVDQAVKIEKMKSEQKDEYDIKKQVEVLDESQRMIPDCQRRLEIAHSELQQLIAGAENLQESAEYKAAQEILASVKM